MPELPDVERFRRELRRHGMGERIAAVEVRDAGVVHGRSAQEFVRQLQGRRFTEPSRHGKWLLAGTDGPTLLIHFGMTGELAWEALDTESSRFDRVVISVGSGKLVYRDQRKLGGLWLVDDDDGVREVIGEQGPDALGLSSRSLEERLAPRRVLKALLMDQRVLAGLGNMLSDEVLWRAGIHPARRFAELHPRERQKLASTLQRVLRASVEAGEIPRRPTWLASQRSRPNPRCPRCRAALRKDRIAGRSSYWCPVCQPLTK